MSTPWLLALVVWMHCGYHLFDNRWAAFASGLGLGTVILLWSLRGPRWGLRWWVVMFGVEEGTQVAVCQLAQNWRPVDSPLGVCNAYFGLPLSWWGLSAAAVLALWAQDLARKNRNGR